jgi:hypothetical protein
MAANDYSAGLNKWIDQLKNDKGTNPKWRNRIVSRAEEIEAMVPKLDTREMSKAEMQSLAQTNRDVEEQLECICPDPTYAIKAACPVHGGKVQA